MKLLKKINILGRIFSIEYCDIRKNKDAAATLGYVCTAEQKIIIDNHNAARQTMESSLLHETLHVISNTLDLGLDEHKVTVLEAALYQVLNDNKLLAD